MQGVRKKFGAFTNCEERKIGRCRGVWGENLSKIYSDKQKQKSKLTENDEKCKDMVAEGKK